MLSQAVILVGGKGTRLGEITSETPKPLLQIHGDRRFLDYLLQRVVERGFTEILLIAGHLGQVVEARYAGTKIESASVSVVIEPSPAGTGGALHHARNSLRDEFLMMNGDSLFDFDFRLLDAALGENDVGVLALRTVEDGRRFGLVQCANGYVAEFVEKNSALTGKATISGGVYALRKSILEWVANPPCSIEVEVFPLLAKLGKLACRGFEGYFIDIGLPDTLEQARMELPLLFDRSLAKSGHERSS